MTITSTAAQQESRLVDRNDLTVEEAKARISSQIPIEDKKDLADHLIDNTSLFENTGYHSYHLPLTNMVTTDWLVTSHYVGII